MTIEQQISIVEDNLNEYGVCDISLEEYEYLKKQIRADAIDEFKDLLLKHKSKDEYPVMCFDEFTLNRFVEQLKEKQDEN